MITLQT
ncbi:hypothetical protein MP638_007375, partial [Amoeboaphelidium occidentale]